MGRRRTRRTRAGCLQRNLEPASHGRRNVAAPCTVERTRGNAVAFFSAHFFCCVVTREGGWCVRPAGAERDV